MVITICQISKGNSCRLTVERCFGLLVGPGRNVRHADMQLLENVTMATTTSSAASDLDPAITNMQPSEEAVHDCPVDEAGDMDDPNNLYTCLEAEECCTVDLNPACCAKKEAADEM